MVRTYSPEKTRQALLKAAFEQIWKQGYEAVSLDDILKASEVTKGALYHHFGSKQALGYAVVDEVLCAEVRERWLEPLDTFDNPIEGLIQILSEMRKACHEKESYCGCPLNNLSQEMSNKDEGFRERLQAIYVLWIDGFAAALKRGQKNGTVKASVNPWAAASFIVSSLEGISGLIKNTRSVEVQEACAAGFFAYLESLKA